MKKISTDQAPVAVGPYSQAINSNNLIFVSGQIPLDPESGELVAGDIAEQTTRVLKNIKAVVEAAGSSMNHVVKTEIYLTDISTFQEVNRIYATFFTATRPARQTMEVSALPLGAMVEISCIAEIESY